MLEQPSPRRGIERGDRDFAGTDPRQQVETPAVAAQPGADRDAIISAARRGSGEVVFEKEGFTWVGHLGLRFDAQGRLLEAKR